MRTRRILCLLPLLLLTLPGARPGRSARAHVLDRGARREDRRDRRGRAVALVLGRVDCDLGQGRRGRRRHAVVRGSGLRTARARPARSAACRLPTPSRSSWPPTRSATCGRWPSSTRRAASPRTPARRPSPRPVTTWARRYSVQANMMANDRVWPAMAEAFEKTTGDLADRLLAALDAAQAAGGDIRGRQSAAILIVKPAGTGKPWAGGDRDLRPPRRRCARSRWWSCGASCGCSAPTITRTTATS